MSAKEGRNLPGKDDSVPPSYYNFEIMGHLGKGMGKGVTLVYIYIYIYTQSHTFI